MTKITEGATPKANTRAKPVTKKKVVETINPDGLNLELGETGIMLYKAKLSKKILTVMDKIGTIAKNGRNDHQRYDFIGHEQVSTALREILPDVGLAILPQVVDHNTEFLHGKTRDGKEITTARTTIHFEFEIVDTDTGFSIIKNWRGTEQDSSGKDFQQCVSTGIKYWQFKMFLVTDKESANDPDSKINEVPTGARSSKPKDPFLAALPSHLKYGKQPDTDADGQPTVWIDTKVMKKAFDAYKKSPKKETAMDYLNRLKIKYKISKANYKKILMTMNLVDENGKEI